MLPEKRTWQFFDIIQDFDPNHWLQEFPLLLNIVADTKANYTLAKTGIANLEKWK